MKLDLTQDLMKYVVFHRKFKEKGYLWQLPKTNSWQLEAEVSMSVFRKVCNMTLGAPKDQEGLEPKSTKVLIQTLHFTEGSLHSSSHLLWSFRGTAGHFGNSKTYIMANTHGNIFSIKVKPFFPRTSC